MGIAKVRSVFEWLRSRGVPAAVVPTVFKRSPFLTGYSIQEKLEPAAKFLEEEAGVSPQGMLRVGLLSIFLSFYLSIFLSFLFLRLISNIIIYGLYIERR
jgi:hypothetical protein